MSDSTINVLENTLKKEKELVFEVDSTPYGRNCYLKTPLNDKILMDTLENFVGFFDHSYHDKFDLETGHSRTYTFTLIGEISVEILYRWEHDEGSKWGVELEEVIKEKIISLLSKNLNCTAEEFEEKYYFMLKFSTKKTSEEDMKVFNCINEKEVELKKTIFEKIKTETHELSQKHGSNTNENHCEFSYDLNSCDDFYISESWIDTVDFDTLKGFLNV